MNAKEYRDANNKMEELLVILTGKGKLSKKDQQEPDTISDAIASYEEEHLPFKP